jgi:hypothetical protein
MSQSTFRSESRPPSRALVAPSFPPGGSLSFRDLRRFFGSSQKFHNHSPAAGIIHGGESLGYSLTHDVELCKFLTPSQFAQFAFDVNSHSLHFVSPDQNDFLISSPSANLCVLSSIKMNQRLAFALLLLAFNGAMWFMFVKRSPNAKVQPTPVATNTARVAKPTPPPVTPIVVVRTNAFEWAQLEAEDYRTYIERLRSIGCPEQTIRDIVIADLEKLMAPRVREIDGHKEPPKYWKPERKELVRTIDVLEKSGKKQEVDFEKREIIRELLGVDLAAERSKASGESDFYEERLNFLDADKRSRVRMIMERANREEIALREKSWMENDELTPEERARLDQIASTKADEIAALLSPEELEQYNLWFSDSAYKVRDSFFAMEPTEEDFLAVYEIQREFDSASAHKSGAEYDSARAEYEQKIREYLGEERYDEFSRSRDSDYQQLQAAAVQFGLSSGIATEVYGFKKVLSEERQRVQEMAGLTAEQRARVFNALGEEAERAVVEVMGHKPYRYYIRSGAGKWIWNE